MKKYKILILLLLWTIIIQCSYKINTNNNTFINTITAASFLALSGILYFYFKKNQNHETEKPFIGTHKKWAKRILISYFTIIIILIIFLLTIYNIDDSFEKYIKKDKLFFDQNLTDILQTKNTAVKILKSIIYYIPLIAIGPIIEEVFFRHILFNYFKSISNTCISLILTCAIFSAEHDIFNNSLISALTQFARLFAGASILQIITIKTKSITTSTILHISQNTLALFIGSLGTIAG
jgi:membrane protease YdiL (CAAX protease family)